MSGPSVTMSRADDLAQISACLRSIQLREQRRKESFWPVKRTKQVELMDMPSSVLWRILSYCDSVTREAALASSLVLNNAWREWEEEEEDVEEVVGQSGEGEMEHTSGGEGRCYKQQNSWDLNANALYLDGLPTDVLLILFKFLDRRSLGRIAQVCSRFRDVSYSDSLWLQAAAKSLGSNQLDNATKRRSQARFGARERTRLGRGWETGGCTETLVALHNIKFMPRLQLERGNLWVAWGKTIWCHPRLKQGSIGPTTTKMLRGHSDDVSHFVVSGGMVVSGGRDRSICGWNAKTGEFLFARRYCHAGDVTAVDVTGRGGRVIVSGSRDKTIGIWAIHDQELYYNTILAQQICVGDRVWSVSVSPDSHAVAVGTGAQRGIPPLRLYNLTTGGPVMELGADLKNGAGMLDISWLSPHTFLACGYDTCTRLWDTRCTSYVRTWEEPFDETVYSLATDNVYTLVTGTARHGRVRVWDMRSVKPLYMRYSTPARCGQSSPVYSLCMDSANIYAALDQSLHHFGFQSFVSAANSLNNNNRVYPG